MLGNIPSNCPEIKYFQVTGAKQSWSGLPGTTVNHPILDNDVWRSLLYSDGADLCGHHDPSLGEETVVVDFPRSEPALVMRIVVSGLTVPEGWW